MYYYAVAAVFEKICTDSDIDLYAYGMIADSDTAIGGHERGGEVGIDIQGSPKTSR